MWFMLGLKLNHVSKRGYSKAALYVLMDRQANWWTDKADYKNTQQINGTKEIV